MIFGIIVAAGTGMRYGSKLPKQFCELCGRPLLMTTIENMLSVIELDHIILVLDPQWADHWLYECAKFDFRTPSMVDGGRTRMESVVNALDVLDGHGATYDSVVLIHDGARPLASPELIASLAVIPDDADGVIPVVPMTDSIRQLKPNGTYEVVDRSRFFAVQTPQAFRYEDICYAYNEAAGQPLTDDASVAEYAGLTRICIREGSPLNIKITNPGDIAIAEAILASKRAGNIK